MNNTVHFLQFYQMLLAVAAQRDKITEAGSRRGHQSVPQWADHRGGLTRGPQLL